MIVAIHQPNFLPWLGYFVKMMRADCFILLDTVTFSKSGYSKRVKVRDRNGTAVWLTVPVAAHQTGQTLNVLPIANPCASRIAILNKLRGYYADAPFGADLLPKVKGWLDEAPADSLAAFNKYLLCGIVDLLQIRTDLRCASSLDLAPSSKDQNNAAIVTAVGGSTYLAGTGARHAYMNEEVYRACGIEVIYNEFSIPAYRQLGSNFIANLSVVDALFNIGPVETANLIRRTAT